jgi:hypothetical protein
MMWRFLFAIFDAITQLAATIVFTSVVDIPRGSGAVLSAQVCAARYGTVCCLHMLECTYFENQCVPRCRSTIRAKARLQHAAARQARNTSDPHTASEI